MSDLKSDEMAVAFQKEFGVGIETIWNIFAGVHSTSRRDGEPFNEAQAAWLKGWDARGVE